MDTSGLIRKEEGEEYSSTVELSSFFCEGDWLYYTGMVYMGTPYAVAGRMSLETGEKQDFACENLLSLAPWAMVPSWRWCMIFRPSIPLPPRWT